MNVADIRDALKAVVEAHATWNNWYSIWSPAKDRASELTYPAAVWGPWRARMVEDEAGAVRRVVQCTLLVVDAVSTERTTADRDATAESAEDAASDFILKLRQDYGRSLTVENVQVSTVHDEGTVLETGVILSFTVNVDGPICLDGDEFNPPTNCPTFEELVAGLTWTEIKADLSPEQIAAAEADLCDVGGPCDPTTVNGVTSDTPTITVVQGGVEVGTLNPATGVHEVPECEPCPPCDPLLDVSLNGGRPFTQLELECGLNTYDIELTREDGTPIGEYDTIHDRLEVRPGQVQLRDTAGNDIGAVVNVEPESSGNIITAPDATVQLKDSAGNPIGSPDSYRSNSSNNKTAPDGSVQRRDSAGTAIGSPIAVRSNQTGLDVTCPDGTVTILNLNGTALGSQAVRSNATASYTAPIPLKFTWAAGDANTRLWTVTDDEAGTYTTYTQTGSNGTVTYSKNGAAYTALSGTIVLAVGDTITVRRTTTTNAGSTRWVP